MSLLNQKLSVMIKFPNLNRYSRGRWFIFLLTIITISFTSQYFTPSSEVAIAQSLQPEKVAEQVYQAIPDFPQENDYISQETNQTATKNTLVSRIVRYHQYTKARPTIFRLDWKLTLADYLSKNEIIVEQRYPGNSTLTQNPMRKDKEVISNLTMQQRDDLVRILVDIYKPKTTDTSVESTTPQNDNGTTTENNSSSPTFKLPKPGGADLLLP